MSPLQLLRDKLFVRCKTPQALHTWIRTFLQIDVPRAPICPGHDAPFEYLKRAYFEPARDQLVWAPRGGGKTRLAAVATLLDLLHKPPVSVRILGGSLEQSLRIWENLIPDIEKLAPHLRKGARQSGRRIELVGGSVAAAIAQSQRAVRGLRVQKLRCDEVEMFDEEIWNAAQLVTRSLPHVRATIEALSTYHRPYGLMSKLVEHTKRSGGSIVRWCLMDVLERCPPERDCKTCQLWDDCAGVAKLRCNGFFSIDDATAIKRRTSIESWEAEMLCRKPSTSGCVFRSFDERVHVRDTVPGKRTELALAIDFGFAAPFVCLWIESRAGGVVHVIDEYVQSQQTMDVHLEFIKSKEAQHGRATRVMCDPAGAGRNEQTARSNVQLLRAAGFSVRHRKSFIADGIEMIRAALKPAAGEPKLFIDSGCATLIRAMQCYHYRDDGRSELPHKDGEHDHPIDALRYYFVNRDSGQASTRSY